MSLFASGPDRPECSRAGCREPAVFSVHWRNPRIHTAERVKVWLACDEHAPWLENYLATRGFPVRVTEFGVVVDSLPEVAE